MKKTRNILVSLLACLFVILAVPTAVSAAAKAPQCPKKQTLEFYNAYISGNEMPTEGDGYIYIVFFCEQSSQKTRELRREACYCER